MILSLLCVLGLWLDPSAAARAQPQAHSQIQEVDPAGTRPQLRSDAWDAETESFRAQGRDPDGPRELVLWSFRDGDFTQISATHSGADGAFDFGEIGVSIAPLLLGVAESGRHPRIEELLVVERPIPAPQIVAMLGEDDGLGPELIVHPARFEGELRIYDVSDGRILARQALAATGRGRSALDVAAILGDVLPEAIWIQQILEDGRGSARAYFRFGAATD
jgi:hypothetical protein